MNKLFKSSLFSLIFLLMPTLTTSCVNGNDTSSINDGVKTEFIYHDGNLDVSNPYLLLYLNETYPLKIYVNKDDKGKDISLISEDDTVVSINKNNCLVANKIGTTTVNIKCDDEIRTLHLNVSGNEKQEFWKNHNFQVEVFSDGGGGLQVGDLIHLGASYDGAFDSWDEFYTDWKDYVNYYPSVGKDLVKQIDRTTYTCIAPGEVSFKGILRDDLVSKTDYSLNIIEFKTYPESIKEEVSLRLIPNANVLSKMNLTGDVEKVPSMLTFTYEVSPSKYLDYVYLERVEGKQLIHSYFNDTSYYHFRYGDKFEPQSIYGVDNAAIGFEKICFVLKLKDKDGKVFTSDIVKTFWTNYGCGFENETKNLTLTQPSETIHVGDTIAINFDVGEDTNNNYLTLVCLKDNKAFNIVYNEITALKPGTYTIQGNIDDPMENKIEAKSNLITINVVE